MNRLEIGLFDNNQVHYTIETDVVECKNVKVFFSTLERFSKSNLKRANLDNETVIIKKEKTYKIGCLEDTHEVFEELRNKIKNFKKIK